MGDSYNTHGLALSRWRPPQPTHLLWACDRYNGPQLGFRGMDDRDEGLSDAGFRRKYECSRNAIREVEQMRLDDKNRMEYGASRRGGFTSVELEKAAKLLDKKEAEEARQAEMRNHTGWLWLMEPGSGDTHLVEILLDTQSDGNFMTQEMAKNYKLQLKGLRSPATFNMAVGEVTCQYRVEVDWMGADNDYGTTNFYVLPEENPRIQKPLLGAESMNEFRDLLLKECPRKSIMYTAMKKKTTDEDARSNQSREQAMADRARLAERKKQQQETDNGKRRGEGSSSKSKKN